MQEDIFPAAEKILSDIENVLKKDPNLIGFEIIQAQDNENKSPVIYDQNSLGLASWSVKPLYCYAYNRLLELRRNRHRREDPSTVSRWLLGALLLNPDVSTFWNMKRELVKSGRLDPFDELRFVAVVLYYKAKCFEAFAYRRWLVRTILMGDKQADVDVEALLRNEISVASASADGYANNYHAWSHREHVVTSFGALSPTSLGSLLKLEWESSGKWCSLHISDHSGFAYRQFLLKRLLVWREDAEPPSSYAAARREVLLKFARTGGRCCDDLVSLHRGASGDVLNLLHGTDSGGSRSDVDHDWSLAGLSYWTEECAFNEELLKLYPGHETLWYHRRFLAHTLLALTASYNGCSAYESGTFDESRRMRRNGAANGPAEERATRTNFLAVAFQTRNRELIEVARGVGGHESVMAERFVKYLASIDLGL